jgi:hypothetical protein
LEFFLESGYKSVIHHKQTFTGLSLLKDLKEQRGPEKKRTKKKKKERKEKKITRSRKTRQARSPFVH